MHVNLRPLERAVSIAKCHEALEVPTSGLNVHRVDCPCQELFDHCDLVKINGESTDVVCSFTTVPTRTLPIELLNF
jgi:hypothetical protein